MLDPFDIEAFKKLKWKIEGDPKTVKQVRAIMDDFTNEQWSWLKRETIRLLIQPNEDDPVYQGGWFVDRE